MQRFREMPQIEQTLAYLKFGENRRFRRFNGKIIGRPLIHSIKYHGNKELAYWMGEKMAKNLQLHHSPLCKVDLLIPVPLHPHKEQERGYNQSEWIARGLQSILSIPIDTTHLERTVYTISQTRHSYLKRNKNVRSVFNVIQPEDLENKHVLLIDDVITSGSTLLACAKILSGIPGIRISILGLSAA